MLYDDPKLPMFVVRYKHTPDTFLVQGRDTMDVLRRFMKTWDVSPDALDDLSVHRVSVMIVDQEIADAIKLAKNGTRTLSSL